MRWKRGDTGLISVVQLFDAEMRCAIIEAETREEVMLEMEERMRTMEEKYSRRLMSEVKGPSPIYRISNWHSTFQLEQNEIKTDAKIDLLHKAGLFGSPMKLQRHSLPTFSDDEEDEEAADVEMSLVSSEINSFSCPVSHVSFSARRWWKIWGWRNVPRIPAFRKAIY